MKNISIYLLSTCIAFLLMSCSSDSKITEDDDVIVSESYFKVNGDIYNLKSAVFTADDIPTPDENGIHESYFRLYTTKLTQENGNIIPEETSFSLISFQIASLSYAELSVGSYTHNSKPFSEPTADTFFGSGFTLKSDHETFSSGNMMVSRKDDIYEISFEGITTTGTKFSFQYKGDIILE